MNLTRFDADNNNSPFDSIRHYDEQGNEFWLARELMSLLGYDKWQNFHKNIKRAYVSCQNTQNDATMHFLLTSVKTSGRTADDWKLSRYACYLIAMNGDPTKIEVAQAQSYFAVKTRQAEVIIPKQNEEIEVLKLKLALANAEKEKAIAEKNLLDTRNYIVTGLPEPIQQKILGYQLVEKKVIEKVVYKEDEFIRNDSTVNKTHLCKRYGILTKSGSCDYKRLNKILMTANLPSEAWIEVKDIQKNNELKVEYLNILDNLIIQDSRQLWIGE